MRCLSLASALESIGWKILFAARRGSSEVVPGIAKVDCINLERDDDPGEIEATLSGRKIDLLVVDSYRLGAAYETACRSFAARILAIDDLADRPHDCDFLLDQTLWRNPADYANLVPPTCRLLLGTDYALLRPAFLKARASSLEARRGRKPVRVLVSFGAADAYGFAPRVAAALLSANENLTLDVVPDSAGREECERLAQQYAGRMQVHFAVEAMEKLMAAADIAVGAAGTMSWERCAMGVPCVLVVTADNQRFVAERLIAAGAAAGAGDWAHARPDAIEREVARLMRDESARVAMSRAAASICDCRAMGRIVAAMAGSKSDGKDRRVDLRLIEPGDAQVVFEWQSASGMRKHFRNPAPPTEQQHSAWMESAVNADPLGSGFVLLICCDGLPVGLLQLRETHDASYGKCREVSILVGQAWQGFGIGRAALALLDELLPHETFIAEIASENLASVRLFGDSGFKAISETRYVKNRRIEGFEGEAFDGRKLR